MGTRFSIEAVFRAIDKMSNPMKGMTKNTNKFSRALRTDFAKAQRSVDRFGTNFKRSLGTGIRVGAGLAAAGIGLVIKEGLALASDLIEVQNVVDQTFGPKASEDINKWSKTTLKAFGLSELQAKEFSGTLGSMIKSSGLSGEMVLKMSKNLTGLAGDIASFRNIKPEEAFEKLQSVITGTTKPLRAIGINMTVANLETFALTKGIKKAWKEMSQAEQVALRYEFVLEKTADMQGDFARTIAETANQQRLLTVNFKQQSAVMAGKILPLWNKLITKVNIFVSSLDAEKIGNSLKDILKGFFKFLKVTIKILKVLKPIAPIILGAVAAFKLYNAVLITSALITKGLAGVMGIMKATQFIFIAATQGMTAAQATFNGVAMANPIGLIITAIGVLIGLTYLIIKNWKLLTNIIIKSWDALKGMAGILGGPLLLAFVAIIEMIRSVVTNFDMIKKAFTDGGFLSGILAIGKALFSGLIEPFQALFEIIGKIPGVGIPFKAAAAGLESIQNKLTGENGSPTQAPQSPISSAERAASGGSFNGELTIKDENNRTEISKNDSPKGFKFALDDSGGM